MKRRSFMQMGVGLGTVGVVGTMDTGHAAATAWMSRTFNALGTSMTIRLAHADAALAHAAMDAAIAAVRQVEDQMSLFRSDSAICQLNRTGRLDNPHPDMQAILRIAQEVSERSQGAFDVTVQPLWLAFEGAQAHKRLPSPQEIAAARALVGWRKLHISSQAIWLEQPLMSITLNGIAQGFAADKVKARLQAFGIAHALIDTGEWAAWGQPEAGRDWTLGIASPRDAHSIIARLAMQGRCVATSADDQCTFSPDFVNHHIFDPRTGYSPTSLSCVSVMAPSCVMADAITKVIFMAGFDAALALAKTWKVDALVVDKRGRMQATNGVVLR